MDDQPSQKYSEEEQRAQAKAEQEHGKFSKETLPSSATPQHPKFYDTDSDVVKAGIGCWWFAFRPFAKFIESAKNMATPKFISRLGDPLIMFKHFRVSVWNIRTYQNNAKKGIAVTGQTLVSFRAFKNEVFPPAERWTAVEEILKTNNVVGVIFFDPPASRNSMVGHYFCAYHENNSHGCFTVGDESQFSPKLQPQISYLEYITSRAEKIDLLLVEPKKPAVVPQLGSAASTPARHAAAKTAGEGSKRTGTEGNAEAKEQEPALASGNSRLTTAMMNAMYDALPFRTNVVKTLPRQIVPDVRNYMLGFFRKAGPVAATRATERLTKPNRQTSRGVRRQVLEEDVPLPPARRALDSRRSDEERRIAQAELRAVHGEYKAATNILMSDKCKIEPEEEPDVAKRLRELHPRKDAKDDNWFAPVDYDAVVPTPDEILKVVKKMPKMRASGPSGLSADVIREILEYEEKIGGTEFLDELTKCVTAILKQQVTGDAARSIRHIRLVALAKRKADGAFKGVRPVAMSETVLKIAALVALGRCPHIGSQWEFQHGMRKGGSEEAVFKVINGVRSKKKVRTFDASNAYNSVWRGPVFNQLRMLQDPSTDLLKAYANFAYGTSSTATYEDIYGELQRIEVQRGFRQGDPCGPILFSMAIQPVLEKVAQQFAMKNIEIIAYLDDIAIIADKDEDLEAASKLLIAEMKKIGLTLRAEYDSEKESEFRYLGAAVTREKKATDGALRKIRPLSSIERFVATVAKLSDHVSLEVLRSCGVSRGGYVARIHGDEAKKWLKDFDLIMSQAVSQFLRVGIHRVRANEAIRRSTKLGGFGFVRWETIAALAHKSAMDKMPMSRVIEAADRATIAAEKIAEWKAQHEGSVPSSLIVANEKPLTGEEYSTWVKLKTSLPQIANRVNTQAGEVHCPGCNTHFTDAQKLIYHSYQCSKVAGHGNTSRRHNAACDAIKRQLNANQLSAVREAPMSVPAKDGQKAMKGYMDVLTTTHAIDVTITNDEKGRIASKKRTYEAMAAHHKVNLVVLCISPAGTILPQSLRFARRLAKMANMSFNEFWAPVITEVIRGTTRSVIETRNLISGIAAQKSSLAADLTLAGPSTVPAHPNASSPAQDADSDEDGLIGDVDCLSSQKENDDNEPPAADPEEELQAGATELFADAATRKSASRCGSSPTAAA